MVDKSKYLDVFIEEARENLQGVNNVLLELEEKGFSEESMKVAYRVVHTIKGTAAVIGIEPISELAHVMEDLFGILVEQKKTPEKKLLNLLFRGADTIEKMIGQLEKDGTTDIKVEGLIADMKKFADMSAQSAKAEKDVVPGELGKQFGPGHRAEETGQRCHRGRKTGLRDRGHLREKPQVQGGQGLPTRPSAVADGHHHHHEASGRRGQGRG